MAARKSAEKADSQGRKVDEQGVPLGGAGAAQKPEPTVQKAVDEETAQGYRLVGVDPTPNDHYTVAGVLAGKPTPETDADAAEKARVALTAPLRKES